MFLYPISEFINAATIISFKYEGHHASELFYLIDKRYREKEYDINWLFFSKENDSTAPDLSNKPDYVKIQNLDNILHAGVSFRKHCDEEVYPEPDYILNQLPEHDKLVIGGFHQWDCVDKLARASYNNKIDTFVDEDTTELFFAGVIFRNIPLIREEWSLKALGIKDEYYDYAVEDRKNKPWLVQK